MKYITKEKAIELLKNMIYTIMDLPKWNGHLYNWYQIKTKEPLIPRYISTVDSGNFIGYMYVVKSFLTEIREKIYAESIRNKYTNSTKEKYADSISKTYANSINKIYAESISVEELKSLIEIIDNIINNTDFSVLYNNELQIFSIGFNIEENKLTESYYDLLASESRQASLVAIAKKDVPAKHWNYLSRTLTTLRKYKGLISWSGTAFEYLMPDINIPRYEGSLLDESCKFMLLSQKEYAKKLNIPWGISEAAFNVKDLKSNYQYKAFGIPWLGLKRGLADELVVSTYGGVLAINDIPEEEIKNLKHLESEGMYDKYGFYESIDYTPERVEKGKTSSVVKTYMAHHQGLILLAINNLFNNKILQKRFLENPEIEAVSILLQETMPEMSIITKEKKEKIEKLKYKDYENYVITEYSKIDERLITGNVIANENYTIAMNQKGEGVSKYKDIYINRFKVTEDYSQGIFFVMKNIKTKQIWSSNYSFNDKKEENYQIKFMPDKIEQEITKGNIKSKIKTTIASNEPVELRRLILENQGNEEETIEITTYFEPVLSKKEQDYAHPVFNNLFLISKFDEETNSLVFKRKKREKNTQEMYLMANLSTNSETIGDLEYEISEEKFIGRGNLGIPNMIKNSIPLSKKIGLVTEPIVALKRIVKIKPNEKINIDFVISVGEELEKVKQNLQKYKSEENVKLAFELSKAKVEAESRYLRIKGKDIALYQKILSYMIFDNSIKSQRLKKLNLTQYKQADLWKYGISGDFPIMLIKIKDANDIYVLKDILKAYEFFRTKNIQTELVILDEEKHSYENYVREEIEGAILNQHMTYLKNQRGGIFNLVKTELSKNDITLLELVSTISINSEKGSLENNIKELEEEYLEKYKIIESDENNFIIKEDNETDIDILQNKEELKYYNEYGGFSADGKEYLIKVNKSNRLPTVWSHILANKNFGTVITENMGGYTWYKNSRLNRITRWENNPNYDIPSEVIYLKDVDTKKIWSLGLNPMPDDKNYNIIYGFGYCKYIHKSDGIEQETEIFVPNEDNCKINIIKLKNITPNHKKIKLYYYIKPVLGEDEIKTNGYICTSFDKNNNIIYAKSIYNTERSSISFISTNEKIRSYTGDNQFFTGGENADRPTGIEKERLNNETGLGKESCMAFEIDVELESYSDKEIVLMLGAYENLIDCKNTAYKYSKISNSKQELETTKRYWKELLRKTTSIYTNRINKYIIKWMVGISNNSK